MGFSRQSAVAVGLCGLTLAGSPLASAAPETAFGASAFLDGVGINIHATHFQGFPSTTYDNWDGVIGAVKTLGIRNVRDHVFDPARLNQLTAATGAKVDGILESDYFPNGILTVDPNGVPAQIALAKQVNGLIAIEGPNEYDQFSDPNWVPNLTNYQTLLYNAAKAEPALANVVIVAPSLTDRHNFAQFSGLAAYADRGNIHSYPDTNTPPSGLGVWQAAAAQMVGAKAVWSTETGYHESTPLNQPHDVSLTAAAKYIPRLLMEYHNAGIEKTFLYELANDNVDPTNSNAENNLGLVNTDFSLRPAGVAVKNLLALLGGTGAIADSATPASLDYTISGGNASLHHTLLQRGDGKFFLALWLDLSVFDKSTNADLTNQDLPITLAFNTPITGVSTYLPDGSINPVASYGAVSQLNLAVPDQVMLVESLGPGTHRRVGIVGRGFRALREAEAPRRDQPRKSLIRTRSQCALLRAMNS